MRRFTALALALDAAETAAERRTALDAYLAEAPATDVAHARRLLAGEAPPRVVSPRQLRRWAATVAGVEEWLVAECRGVTGELAEAVALLLPAAPSSPLPLATWIEARLLPLAELPPAACRDAVVAAWRELDRDQRWLWNRLLLGTYRPRLALEAVAPPPSQPPRHRIEAVLLYARRGRGSLVSFYSDYTFGVWEGDELVPLVRIAADPADELALRRIDRFVRREATERFGPVRAVPPRRVAVLEFAAVRPAPRRRCGLELVAPRLAAWSSDTQPAAADHLSSIVALLES